MITSEYLDNELKNRIEDAQTMLKSAEQCLKNSDYLQCAVRLQELKKIGAFTQLEIDIMDAESGERI